VIKNQLEGFFLPKKLSIGVEEKSQSKQKRPMKINLKKELKQNFTVSKVTARIAKIIP